MQRDLTEYVLMEENRITIYLHRAGWHFARSKPQGSLPSPVAGRATLLPSPSHRNGDSPSDSPTRIAVADRQESHRLDDKAPSS
jgi:hypothetical protein